MEEVKREPLFYRKSPYFFRHADGNIYLYYKKEGFNARCKDEFNKDKSFKITDEVELVKKEDVLSEFINKQK